MAMIGEELMALLGMIPVRDRAGIPRGNLAQETVANASQMDGAGPAPRPPIATPPDVTLPDNIPVGYASAKSPVSTAIPSNGRAVQNALPEPDTTRTIAATPPAATGQMEEMLARVQRANAIRSAIGGFQQAFGGGGGDGGGTQVAGGIDTKDITDMFKTRELLQKADDDRRAAAQAVQLRERMIQDMMARRGISRAHAEGAIATGEAKDAYSQDKTRQYAEDLATVAQRDDMLKRKGEIAKKLDMTEDEVATQLRTREGTTELIKRLDPESRSTIAGRNATTGKVLIDTAETANKLETTKKDRQSYEGAIADLSGKVPEVMAATGLPEWQVRAELKTGEILKRIDPAALSKLRSETETTAGHRLERETKERGIKEHDELVANLLPRAQEIADRNDMDIETARDMIRTNPKGALEMASPRARAEVAKLRAATAKETVEAQTGTEKLRQEVDTAAAFKAARDKPIEFMEKHGIKDPVDYRKITENQQAYETWAKDQATTDPWSKGLVTAKRDDPTMTAERWKTLGVANPKPSEGEKGRERALVTISDNFKKSDEDITATHNNLTTSSPHIQRLYKDGMVSGSGLSQWSLDARKTLGFFVNPKGQYDDKVVNTEAFYAAMHEHILNKAKYLKPMSNSDFSELEKMTGASLKTDPNSVRLLLRSADLVQRAEVEKRNDYVREMRKSPNQGIAEYFASQPILPQPPPATFTTDHFEQKPPDPKVAKIYPTGRDWLKASIADGSIYEPDFKKEFEQIYGTGTLPYFRNQVAPEGLPWTDPRR